MYIFSNNSFSSFKSSLFIYSIPSFIAGIILLEYVLSISVIFAVGVYLMASSGFSWLKLFFLLWMTSSSGLHSGVVASGILIANFTSLLQSLNGMNLWIYSGYGWIAITLISIAYILLTQYIWLVWYDLSWNDTGEVLCTEWCDAQWNPSFLFLQSL